MVGLEGSCGGAGAIDLGPRAWGGELPFWVGLNFNYIHISPVYGWVNCEGGGARAAARRVAPRQHLALAVAGGLGDHKLIL